MSKLELLLLGHFECLLPSGEPVKLSMRKAEVLLAYLALAPGIRHPRERLINLLWSNRGEEQARNSLRQALSSIKKSLGNDADLVLQVDRNTISLNADLVDVDLHEFERLATTGDFEALTTAIGLYQGEFLEGITIRDPVGQDWLENERSRFKRQFIDILTNLAETQLASHDFATTIKSAERLVKEDPLREIGWRLLMQGYHENGERNHALQAFKRCQRLLREELEVEPEKATLDLKDRIANESGAVASRPAPESRKPFAGRPASTDHSIAVLPFDNLSGDPEQEYLSDGITDSIILNLSLFPGLNVKSRYSSFAFKQQIKSLGDISRELGVDYLVEGSVRRSGGRVLVNVQLIEAASSDQVWGKRYDAELDNLFDLEEDMSRSIAATVTGKIASELQRIAISKGAADQQAYDLLLAGIYHVYRFTRQNNATAIDRFRQCLAQDPDNVRAHAFLSACHVMDYLDRWTVDYRASFEMAGTHIRRALALESDLALVNTFYGEYLNFCKNFEEAEVHLEKSLAHNPNDPDAITTLAMCKRARGDHEEALALAKRACRLDPYHPWAEWRLASSQYLCGQYEDALATHKKFRTSPDFNSLIGIATLVKLDRLAEARQALQAFLQNCRETMLSMPQSLEEWRQYVSDNFPYPDSTLSDELVDCLLQAGLEGGSGNALIPIGDNSHTIAVLPFDNLSGDPEQEYFSDGITDSIIVNLALFPGLNVKSRNSSFAFKQQIKSVGEICDELRVDYIVEGSIRRSQDRVRITVQLIDSGAGNQIWGKRYDADLCDLFALEEELSRSIAATVTGQIESELQRIALARGAAQQQAYDLLLAGTYHMHRFNRHDNAIAKEKFDQCLSQDPDNVLAHAHLYLCHGMDIFERWSSDCEESRKLAEKHILRALELGPELVLVQTRYAEHLLFNGEFAESNKHLAKALATNPYDPVALSIKATMQMSQGDFEAGLQTAEKVCELDPYHPWAGWELAAAQYFCESYQASLETISAAGASPGFESIFAIAANIKLGEQEKARQIMQRFLQQCRKNMGSMPRSLDEWHDYTRSYYPFIDPGYNQDLVDCLVQAGLEEELQAAPMARDPETLPSILVLPFSNLSGDPEQEYFSAGITESIIVNLSSFSGLRVKSRHTTFAFKDSARSIDDIAAELGVDYVVEGSIRKFSDKVRITVQLGDAARGDQIWGRRFDSELVDLLDLEQELSRTIAGTVMGRIDHDVRQVALRKPAKDLRSYDFLMRGIYHIELFTAKDNVTAMQQFEKCLSLDPDNAWAQATLGMAHIITVIENFSEDPAQSMDSAQRCLTRALDLNPDDATAHAYMAEFHMYQKNFDLSQMHARKSIELNPTLADGYSILAWHAGATGQHDKAIEYADRSMQIDQFHPYVGWNAGEVYRDSGDYAKAIGTFRSMAHMSPSVHAQIAACFAGLGRIDEARAEMRQFLDSAEQHMYRVPANEAEWRRFWEDTMPYKDAADSEKYFDLLLQAGICDAIESSQDGIPSIAVLPFENMSDDPEQAFFSDGITADIIATLSKFRHMRIVARHSTEIYRNHKASIADIASEQRVRYILEGSVRKNGDRIRVNAELIDAASEQNIWSERYDRDLDDIFAVQDEITRNIAVAMKVQLTDGERSASRTEGTRNVKAWELVLLAVDLQDSYIQRNILDSRKMIRQALELDPEYAYAWVILGWTHWQEAYSGWTESFEQSMQDAAAAVDKALELEPDNGEAWALASTIHLMNHEADKAIAACQRALELEPGNAEVHALAGFKMNFIGDYEQGTEHFTRAIDLCPICPNWYYLVGAEPEREAGKLDKAIELLRRGVAAEPGSPLCRFYLADALLELGDEAAARTVAAEIRKLDKTMNGRGLVRAYSNDPGVRDRFYQNLAKLDLA